MNFAEAIPVAIASADLCWQVYPEDAVMHAEISNTAFIKLAIMALKDGGQREAMLELMQRWENLSV